MKISHLQILCVYCVYIVCVCVQMVTLNKDPSHNPRQWVQAAEFVPVSSLTQYNTCTHSC